MMKKYYFLGELLTDYRHLNNLTQLDLASVLEVDARTIARWEKNMSLIKQNKEEVVVEKTFIPYQVIHNLNAAVPMPVYYDFKIRKYSLTAVEQKVPDAEWFRSRIDTVSFRVRLISNDNDIDHIARYHRFLYNTEKPVRKSLIKEAARVLPNLNLMLYDVSGFYAGHIVTFPISLATFQKLKNRQMVEGELLVHHLTNYKTSKPAIFYGYSWYSDCNENGYYLMASLLRFFKNFERADYILGGLSVRHDGLKLLNDLGLQIIWEDKEEQEKLNMIAPPTFFEGQFSEFLLGY